MATTGGFAASGGYANLFVPVPDTQEPKMTAPSTVLDTRALQPDFVLQVNERIDELLDSAEAMAELRRLGVKVIIDNYPDGVTEELEAVNNPEDPNAGSP